MNERYEIELNLLLLAEPLAKFSIFRKPRGQESRPSTNWFGFSLPVARSNEEWARYWVAFEPEDEFEEFVVAPLDNVYLTQRALFDGLMRSVNSTLSESSFAVPRDGFFEELQFNGIEHPEGIEQLVVQPYFLRRRKEFGWLLDYHFRKKPDVPFSRKIQQLSLTLDKNFKRNLNYYVDRYEKVNTYLSHFRGCIDSVALKGISEPVRTQPTFACIPAARLGSKSYLFAGDRSSKSQFNGLKQYGPLTPLPESPKLLFVFREVDRPAARKLAVAIRGASSRERYSFPGFQSLFKSEIEIDGDPFVLEDLSQESFKVALARVQSDRENRLVIPIFVLPDGEDNGYTEHKAIFSHAGIPTQVCTLQVINDDYTLKWSAGNIALQIFCKAGGQPWKVKPSTDETLIVGVSQSHKLTAVETGTNVSRYFAFSVLTDNSGLFRELDVLGDSSDQDEYLRLLRTNLAITLREESTKYKQVVIHTSFRLSNAEMNAIEETVKEAANSKDTECRFAVVKVNQKNRYFGVNRAVNSLVPYEATYVNMGGGEYLIWFEGIYPDKQTVNKAFPGPTHLVFLKTSSEDRIADNALLQDLVNLSGANWRGFNAKSAPVSIFYCHLIAEFVQSFHQRDLPLPQVQDLNPWFL